MCCAVALDDVELEVDGVESLAPGEGEPAAAALHGRGAEHGAPVADPDAPASRCPWASGCPSSPVPGTSSPTMAPSARFVRPTRRPILRPRCRRRATSIRTCLIPGGRYTTHVFEHMKAGDTVQFEAPWAASRRRQPAPDPLFVAGDGFAPIKSIVEDRLPLRHPQADDAVLGRAHERGSVPAGPGRSLAARAAELPPPCRFRRRGRRRLTDRRGLVHQAMLADHPSPAGFEVYACGSVRMVEAAVP